ncbi:YggS family pyridoxal phosphate-dependent enzyme [Zobellella maritima]|uniref:YggS family pyridoxal phosphate-dependent enzyme n=1 Tax=Zobellella maritima TaxID=2059725 RepID=UPI000E30ABE9|nr:YggS family pyridoxal phosphate-dependent enzyme [Zobellella maritima]
MKNIAQHLQLVQDRIAKAASESSRPVDDIHLLAVSKTKPIADIEQAYAAGQRQFGENYVQEAIEKIQQLTHKYPDMCWHLIGPLQSNKSRQVAEHFDWVQTVDRLKIAQRLSEQRPSHLPPLNICLQVNVSGETSKSGLAPAEALSLAASISDLPGLRLRGLMAIPEHTDEVARLESQFLELKQLFDRMAEIYPDVDTLSMGMSEDLEMAVACGSTLVRVGTAIFGTRN